MEILLSYMELIFRMSGLELQRNIFLKGWGGVRVYPCSIIDGVEDETGSFDVVFSMHCLEQIPYKSEIALKEMYRLTKKFLIIIEPIFELGNLVQRLYLLNSDHNRILLRNIRHLGYKITRLEALNIQSNPVNQSSIIVIEK